MLDIDTASEEAQAFVSKHAERFGYYEANHKTPHGPPYRTSMVLSFCWDVDEVVGFLESYNDA